MYFEIKIENMRLTSMNGLKWEILKIINPMYNL